MLNVSGDILIFVILVLYFFEESFSRFEEPSDKKIINGELIVEDNILNTNVTNKVKIQNLKKMERLDNLTISLSFSNENNFNLATCFLFSFLSEFEIFLFSYKLDSTVRKGLKEK